MRELEDQISQLVAELTQSRHEQTYESRRLTRKEDQARTRLEDELKGVRPDLREARLEKDKFCNEAFDETRQ